MSIVVTQKRHKLERYSIHFIVGFSISVAVYLFSTFPDIPVNMDAGYTIPPSQQVMNGAVPTVDVHSQYTPFIYYTLAMWMSLFGKEFSIILLLVYIVNVLNALLLYVILSQFITQRTVRILLCVSYYYTIFLCQGYSFFLEPFQTVFVLLAYYYYCRAQNDLVKFPLIGLLLGISIMFKQYSLFFLIGFLVLIWRDRQKDTSKIARLLPAVAVFLFSLLPFLFFIIFSKANIIDSMHAFGLFGNLGNRNILGAVMVQRTFMSLLERLFEQLLHYNWLFIPSALYAYLWVFRRRYVNSSSGVFAIWFSSIVPLFFSQYGHYFQLIAPWSYIIWAVLLEESINNSEKINRISKGKKRFNCLTISALTCIVLVLLPFTVLTPSFYSSITGSEASIAYIASIIALFMLSVSVVFFAITYFSVQTFNRSMIILLIASIIGFQTLFLALKIPFKKMKNKKIYQISEASEITEVFSRQSTVLVVCYPELYVTCDFFNPLGEYSIFYTKQKEPLQIDSIDFSNVTNIVVRKGEHGITFTTLNELGFKELEASQGLRVSFFSRRE